MRFYSKWLSIGYPWVKTKSETEPDKFWSSELENREWKIILELKSAKSETRDIWPETDPLPSLI